MKELIWIYQISWLCQNHYYSYYYSGVVIPFFNNTVLFGDLSRGTEITLENIVLLVIFVLASFTDFLDGYIARKRNIITNFGKFMDPLADKLLVFATIIVLLERGRFSAFGFGLGFVVTLMIAREFIVTGIRLLAVNENVVIAASKLGKAKTVSQMIDYRFVGQLLSLCFAGRIGKRYYGFDIDSHRRLIDINIRVWLFY